MYVCDHRHHRIFALGGPVHLVSKLVHCPDPTCPGHPKTFSPEAETAISLPWWVIGGDVFCWIGQRRFARHWSVSQIRAELADRRRFADCLDRGLGQVAEILPQVRKYVDDVRAVAATLEPSGGSAQRETQCTTLQERRQASEDPIHRQMARLMTRFQPGLFAELSCAALDPERIGPSYLPNWNNGILTLLSLLSDG